MREPLHPERAVIGGTGCPASATEVTLGGGAPRRGPALVVGLVPSLVVLTGEPRSLTRTLGLTVVAAGWPAFVYWRQRR